MQQNGFYIMELFKKIKKYLSTEQQILLNSSLSWLYILYITKLIIYLQRQN